MELKINGESRTLPDDLTVASLVAHLNMKADRVAVELNLEIVPRSAWDATQLKDGDKLEIVHFVGGGADDGAEATAQLQEEAAIETPRSAGWRCPNCAAESDGKFCPACGEKHSSSADLAARHLVSHALEVLFHADSKIFRSFRLLFTSPGFLSAEYSRGRRKPYLHPFQVFFVANVIYFLLQPLTHWTGLRTPLYVHTHMMSYSSLATRLVAERAAGKGVGLEEFTQSFNHVVDLHARSLVVLMVPLFALALWVLEWRKRRFFGEHLVFALHFYALWLIALFLVVFGLSMPVILLLAHHGVVFSNQTLDTFLSRIGEAGVFVYLLVALRTFYRDSIVAAAVKAALLVASLFYIMALYRFILFLTALYSA